MLTGSNTTHQVQICTLVSVYIYYQKKVKGFLDEQLYGMSVWQLLCLPVGPASLHSSRESASLLAVVLEL